MSKSAFMIMPFGDELSKNIYKYSISPICDDYNLKSYRADEIFTTNPILDDIVMAIEKASVIIADISGKNANIFYELGMSHMLKRKSTIMITHDDYKGVPFDIAHFRIIKYEDSIEGKTKFEKEFKLTLNTILKDLKEIYKEEYRNTVEIFLHTNKISDLYYLPGLQLSQKPIKATDPISVEGHNEQLGKTGVGQSVSSLHALKPFLAISYVEIIGDTLSLTEKGSGFSEYLNDLGYKVDRLNDQTFTRGFIPYFEKLLKEKTEQENKQKKASKKSKKS